MKKNIYDIMLNPTRMRIVQVLALNKSMTANEISEVINDIPRTTLYRHITILIKANILVVVGEEKIRGTVERTLSINVNELSKPSHSDNIPQQALGFLMGIYSRFEKYYQMDASVNDSSKLFFNNTVMMLTDEEFDSFLSDLQKLFVNYHFEAADGRKPRDISIISSPSKEDSCEEPKKKRMREKHFDYSNNYFKR